MLLKPNTILITFVLAIAVWSCSDDPASNDSSEAPDAPSLEKVEMDFSIFENSENFNSFKIENTGDGLENMPSIQQTDENPAFEQAALFASFAEMWFQIMGQLPSQFFQENLWGTPDIDDDTWIWEWSHAYQGESISMRITAEEVGNERHWELRYTTTGMEQNLDNALLIASQVRTDGSGGSWQMFDFLGDDPDNPVFETDYEIDGEITTMVELTFDDEDDGRYLYQRNGVNSSLQMWEVMSSGHSIIEWNNETGTGSIQSPDYQDGAKMCWNESFDNTVCAI